MATKKTTTKTSTTKTSVKESNNTALATTNKNNAIALSIAEEDGGAAQDFDRSDLSIPRISVIQSNSPQVKKNEGKFIKGAEEGDFLETVANEVFAKGEAGFIFVPVSYRRTDIEWVPRKSGGGFVADHGSDGEILKQCTKDDETGAMLLPNGNEIVTTAEYIGFIIKDGEEPRQACISLAKTQLKKARRLNTVVSTLRVPRTTGGGTFNPAMFYSYFRATTVPEKSKKGESFMGWSFVREGNTLDLANGHELYMSARGFRESIAAGEVKVAQPNDVAGEPDDNDDSKL